MFPEYEPSKFELFFLSTRWYKVMGVSDIELVAMDDMILHLVV